MKLSKTVWFILGTDLITPAARRSAATGKLKMSNTFLQNTMRLPANETILSAGVFPTFVQLS